MIVNLSKRNNNNERIANSHERVKTIFPSRMEFSGFLFLLPWVATLEAESFHGGNILTSDRKERFFNVQLLSRGDKE